MASQAHDRTQALRIALLYACASAAWILLSDRTVAALVDDPARRTTIEIIKGWTFVAVTAVMLWFLVSRALRRQRAAASAREAALAREQAVFDANRDALLVFPLGPDGPGRFTAVNGEACRRLGRSQEEMLRLGPPDINAPEQHAHMAEQFGRLRREGMALCESEHVAVDGTRIPVEIAARLVELDGCPTVVSSVRDLRQRRAEQTRLAEAERMAALGLLAGGLAHEFNNLHAVALGHLEFVEMDAERNEGLKRHAVSARTALERAAALTRSLLDFARPGGGVRMPERLDLVAAETLALVRRQLLADGVAIDDACAPLPPVAMDRSQIGQAVMNLLINANQAMAGRPQRRLALTTASAPGRVGLSIADTGCGIAAEDLERIFLPFYTSKPGGGGRARGTGLGLSITKAMVEAHGGSIEVASTLGVGSVFKLWLPAS